MGFLVLLFLSALSIAGSAAFFSVYGLARVFSGAFWPVVIMASSLEGGKLISASFLYRHWKTTSLLMKSYLITAILMLMLITSMGIFGFLSSAFQDNILPYQVQNQKIQLLENEKTEAENLKAERLTRQEEINKQIANLPDNSINGRRRLMAANKDELDQIRKDITQYTNDIRQHTTEISAIKGQVMQETAHVGPIIFIADALGLPINNATKWLIFMIIVAFDPLAVMLTIGFNMALREYQSRTKTEPEPKVILPRFPEYVPKPSPPQPSAPKQPEFMPQPGFGSQPMPLKPRITQPDGWYSEDGGMSFKNPAPHAAAPMGGPFTTYTNGVITSGGPVTTHNVVAAGPFTAPVTPPPEPQNAAVVNYFNRKDLTPQEQTMRDSITKTIQNYTEVAENLRKRETKE